MCWNVAECGGNVNVIFLHLGCTGIPYELNGLSPRGVLCHNATQNKSMKKMKKERMDAEFNLRLTPSQMAQVSRIAVEEGTGKSKIIRDAIELLLAMNYEEFRGLLKLKRREHEGGELKKSSGAVGHKGKSEGENAA